MSNIKIKDLKFSYDKKNYIFDNLNFTLRKDKTLSIVGTGACGKTTLLKILNGELDYEGSITINGLEVKEENFLELRKCIAVIFRDTSFITDVVKNELRFSLENINEDPAIIKEKINEINEYFGINKLLNKNIDSLSINDKTLVKILSYALIEPSYIDLDDLLDDLNLRTKILLLN